MSDTDDRIRERAHAIWEAQGHPEGKAEEHWQQAADEIALLDQQASADAGGVLPNPLATGAAAEELAKSKRRKKLA